MKRLIALICAFFVMLSTVANAAYTGREIQSVLDGAFMWLSENVSPLGGTDSNASNYYVMALKRSGRAFDYGKYEKITKSRTPLAISDAQHSIMANAACGGRISDKLVAENTYNASLKTTSELADAITALCGGEYKIKSTATDINRMAVRLLGMQNSDGRFGENTLSTAKSIIALSFLSGNAYIVKGKEIGEQYRYDVNSAILRGVNYLQNCKADDFGFGDIKTTAYAIMALDSAGVDADNDPGFSDGERSTLRALIEKTGSDGQIGKWADESAVAVCALVSHMRAMQGNSPFFALLTEDMPYNPNDYIEDINRSGEGLKVETQTEIKVMLNSKISADNGDKPFELSTPMPIETETGSIEKKSDNALSVAVIIISIIILVATVTWFVVYMLNIKPVKKFHRKETKDEDDQLF